ncbi:MAG: hypothetical protein ACKVH8_13945 [Pirellulales bacterium]
MSQFEDRLKKAIQRGEERSNSKQASERAKAMSEEEYRTRHTDFRLTLSEHIENCLQSLPSHFPGFDYETVYGDTGWGGACFRDDIDLLNKKRRSLYSRIELTVRPYSDVPVLEIAGKATIRNKEFFTRTYFEKIADVDIESFSELIDRWTLEYAEAYSSKK